MKNKLSKKVEKEILSKEWTFGYDRRMGFRLINLFYDGYTRAFNTYFGTQFSDNVFRIKDGIVAQYFPTNSDKKNLKKIEGLFLDNKFASKILKQIVSSYRIFNRYVEKMPISYTGKSNQFHYRQLSKFLKQERGISRTSRILFSPFEELLVKRLDSLLKEKEMSNASDIKETLSLQTELLPSDEYKKDLCSVVLKRMTIKTLTKKYKHFGMLDWYYEEETEADHLKKIQELTEEGAQSYLNELKDKYKNRKLDVSKIKKIFKNDKVLSSLIDLYVVYANYKELKNYWRGMASYKLKFIMSEIAQRLNLSNEQVAFLTYEEIENALLFKKEIKKEELDNRMKNSVFIYKQDKLYIVNDGNFLERLDIVLNSKEQTELQGTSAFRGLVRGVVKIVISSNDFKKVNQGDILVTSTTRPDYIKVMEKAGAFVTNEGGMLSHAAILAREMKKPCVIGTKVATKVLKDGDLVEVD
ncbi:MAG: phosphoenolpyruvate synthase, partial [Candidatus Taylorbacteria bacterium]|nr:phosphoenolpyruvate synthase [Candidatus Taylorbacteria bacterium]